LGEEINKIIVSTNNLGTQVETVTNAFIDLQDYVNNYFDNLDVQDEINNKLNEMAEDGTLNRIINQEIFGNINQSIDNINQNIEDINSDITNLSIPNIKRNRKYCFIGDSYDANWNPEQEVGRWSDIVIRVLNLSENEYIRNALGGACLGNPENSFYNLINQLDNDNAITDIVIAGGYNDQYYNLETIATAGRQVDTLIKQKFPNATIHLGFIGWSKNGLTNKTLKNTIFNYIRTSKLLGWHFLVNCEYSLKDYVNCFNYDGVHPTTYGLELIGRNIAEALIYNTADVFLEKTLGGTSSGVCNSLGLAETKITLKNDITSITNNGLTILGIANNTEYSANGNNPLEIGELDSTLIWGYDVNVPFTGWAIDNGQYRNINGHLNFQNGKIYLFFRDLETSGYHYYTNLTQIVITALNHTVNSLDT
jgi:hypothetical protein